MFIKINNITKIILNILFYFFTIFICSGRPKAMLDEKWLDGTFDGYILNNGGYVEIDENLFMKIEWIMSYV